MVGNPIDWDPGVQIYTFCPKMTPNIGIIQIRFILDHLIMQSNHTYTFRTKHNGISSDVMANSGDNPIHRARGGQIPTF